MFRIWGKIIKDGRIVRNVVYESFEKFDYANFFDYLTEICYRLDCPTPLLMKTHIFNYAKFSHVRFKEKDFVESIDFDALYLENITA